MSRMSEIAMNIQDAIVDAGYDVDCEAIAKRLNIPVQWVKDEYAEMCETSYDGQPDEAQEWHDFDPDC